MIVIPLDIRKVLEKCKLTDPSLLKKRQVVYLKQYLEDIHAKTAVIEENYVDRDFVEDYAHYYSRCFTEYQKKCFRIHFFSESYNSSQIKRQLLKAKVEKISKFEKSYLGFMVLRPLKRTIIGRTCLVPYERLNGKREYLAMRDVNVSFFGRALKVRCMPYQEQDSAVAACATCALWSALQVTAAVFGHKEFSPGMVTATATEHGMSLSRSFPNRSGLCAQDMAYAVRHLGLDLVPISLEGVAPSVGYGQWMLRRILLGNLFAYLGLGIPIVLLGVIQSADGSVIGGHAVVVNGYRLADGQQGLPFKDLRIQKIYCHDDQYGPYMGLELRDSTTAVFNARWPESADGEPQPLFIPRHLFIPVYHKVRVSYEEVWSSVYEFDKPIRVVFGENIEWSISLTTSNKLKEEIRSCDDLSAAKKLMFIQKGFSRYVWKIEGNLRGRRTVLFCIDSTDSCQGLRVDYVVFFTEDIPMAISILPSTDSLLSNDLYLAVLRCAA